jgi:hypothetical protein
VGDTASARAPWVFLRCVELRHATGDPRGGGHHVTSRVPLVHTTPTFGGRRWWFVCPRTACRTTKLFLPNGGQHFLSRRAYGLAYDAENEGRLERLRRKAARLSYQLGEPSWSFASLPPEKPKWMRWPTYEQKIAEWQSATDAAQAELERRVGGMLDRFHKHVPDGPTDLNEMLTEIREYRSVGHALEGS